MTRPRQILLLLALGLLLLSVACAVATKHERTESVFVAEQPEDLDQGFAKTPAGAEVRWARAQVPLLVVIDRSAESWHPLFARVAKQWNAAVGFNLFIVLGCCVDDPNRDIDKRQNTGSIPVYTVDLPLEAATHYVADTDTGQLERAVIYMPLGTYRMDVALQMAAHELGHAVGLAHDPHLLTSIMHNKINGTDPAPRVVTASDVLALQVQYGD